MLSSLIFACGGGGNEEIPTDDDNTVEENPIDEVAIGRIIESFSSSIEMAAVIKDLDVPFSKKNIVPSKVSDSYDSNFKKALGLGMYSSDLGYLNVYGQINSIIEYLTVIKRLSKSLDIDRFFDFQTLKELTANNENLDSLMFLSVSSYNNMSAHLRKSKRSDLSVLMVTGVWIEGIYLACEVNKLKASPKLRDRIGEQKEILGQLYYVLKYFEKRPYFPELIVEFEKLKEAYSSVRIIVEKGETTVDTLEDGTILINPGEHTTIEMTDEQLDEISETIIKIRNKLIAL